MIPRGLVVSNRISCMQKELYNICVLDEINVATENRN